MSPANIEYWGLIIVNSANGLIRNENGEQIVIIDQRILLLGPIDEEILCKCFDKCCKA